MTVGFCRSVTRLISLEWPLPPLPSQTVHLHALEMDVLEIVEALDHHQELGPNLGTN